MEPFFPSLCLITIIFHPSWFISSYVPNNPYLQIIFSKYSKTFCWANSFFQNKIVSLGIVSPNSRPILKIFGHP